LSSIDLEFLIISCGNATLKIYEIDDEISDDDVNSFIGESVADD